VNLTDQVAVVTGGTSGLGLATVQALAEAGAHVVAIDLPGHEPHEPLAANAVLRTADVTSASDVQSVIDEASTRGPLRLVVNCAGRGSNGRVLGKSGPLDLGEFELTVKVNLVGTFNVMRIAAQAMSALDPVDGERGVIVNTASVSAYDGTEGQIAYAASKAGVAGMTLPAARDLARHLIRVVAIAPGPFETPMLSMLPPDRYEQLTSQIPHPRRLGRPEEFGELVLSIVRHQMLNGEVIRFDGGARMGFP
jgi:NAD(P)-dependent dehydrogenase (short-subunit alcohol dehydrogenase family)